MAIHRGIQSAIFYYLSCAPYFEAQTRKKRKKEAKRDRAERELLEAELPNLYRHPSPSSTNPYWQTEIALGPAPLSRGRKKQYQLEKQRSQRRPGTGSSDNSGIASTVDLPRGQSNDDRYDSKHNFQSYQREDEQLWGSAINLNPSGCGDSIRRPPTARTKDSTRSNFQSFRNPAINDLHPATVTKVTSREEVMWMMQPPPVAEVMNGKERVCRSRSNSGVSRPSSKQTSNRSDPQRLASISTVSTGATSVGRTINDGSGLRLDGSNEVSERDFASPVAPRGSHERLRPSPLIISRGASDPDINTVHRPSIFPDHPVIHPSTSKQALRPPLPTIISRNDLPTAEPEFITPAESPEEISFKTPPQVRHKQTTSTPPRPHITQGSAILVHENSLTLVQDLHPGSGGVLNKKMLPAITPSSPIRPFYRHSPVDSMDTSGTNSAVTLRPDMYESWYTPDFKLPDWVHEHTRREVEQRWSMDF